MTLSEAKPARESAGLLYDDVPYMRFGQGPPLVTVLGLTPSHDVPTGWMRRMMLAPLLPLSTDFTIYVVNRKRGLRAGESMSDIAGHLANAIEQDIGEAVFLHGTSTGGSVAMQLAADRPELVRRLVVVAAAYRLGPSGRDLQAEMARLIRVGRSRQAWASVMKAMFPRPLRPASWPISQLTAGPWVSTDPADLLITLDAEDAFNLERDLPRITAATLVIGGGRDAFYAPTLFEDTAAGVRDGRAHIFAGWGHGRSSTSTATTHLTLGFMLAGLHGRRHRPAGDGQIDG